MLFPLKFSTEEHEEEHGDALWRLKIVRSNVQGFFFWIQLIWISNSTNVTCTLINCLIHAHLIEFEFQPHRVMDLKLKVTPSSSSLGSGWDLAWKETILRCMQTVEPSPLVSKSVARTQKPIWKLSLEVDEATVHRRIPWSQCHSLRENSHMDPVYIVRCWSQPRSRSAWTPENSTGTTIWFVDSVQAKIPCSLACSRIPRSRILI